MEKVCRFTDRTPDDDRAHPRHGNSWNLPFAGFSSSLCPSPRINGFPNPSRSPPPKNSVILLRSLAIPKTIQFVWIEIWPLAYLSVATPWGNSKKFPYIQWVMNLCPWNILSLSWIYCLVQPLLTQLVSTKRRQKTMELIFAICVTGLGLFRGMFFIWKDQHQ